MTGSWGCWRDYSPIAFWARAKWRPSNHGGTNTESLTGVMRETFVDLGGEVVFTGSINVFDSGYVRRNVISIDAIKSLW